MSTATKRITVPLSWAEWEALRKMADNDCRHPKDQARYIVKRALQAAGNDKPAAERVPSGQPA